MTMIFKALSALLSYPTADLKAAIPELAAVIEAEALVPDEQRRGGFELPGRVAPCVPAYLQGQNGPPI